MQLRKSKTKLIVEASVVRIECHCWGPREEASIQVSKGCWNALLDHASSLRGIKLNPSKPEAHVLGVQFLVHVCERMTAVSA